MWSNPRRGSACNFFLRERGGGRANECVVGAERWGCRGGAYAETECVCLIITWTCNERRDGNEKRGRELKKKVRRGEKKEKWQAVL